MVVVAFIAEINATNIVILLSNYLFCMLHGNGNLLGVNGDDEDALFVVSV